MITMKTSTHFSALAIIGVLLTTMGCDRAAPPVSADGSQPPSSAALDRVSAGPPVRKTLALYTQQPGRIAAYAEAPLFSKLAGYVQDVQVDIGDQVKKDQLLVQLFVPEYKDELEQKRGLLAQAEAEVQQSEAALIAMQASAHSATAQVALAEASIGRADGEYARSDSERQRLQQLVNTGSVTAKIGEEALNQFRSAESAKQEALANVESAKAQEREAEANINKSKADVIAAQARVRVAQANVTQAETMLAYTEIRAPFDGVVTQRGVDQGHYVHPASSPSSQPLLTVASTNKVRVFVDIPEMEAPLLDAGYDDENAGDKAVVRVQSLAEQVFEARVTRSSWSLDGQNRSLTAEINLPNKNGELLPGSFATVNILLEQRDDVLTLPITAVVRDGQKTFCCVVVAGQIEQRPIELGLRVKDEVEIASGLDGTEAVVLTRAGSLQSGQRVEIIAKGKA